MKRKTLRLYGWDETVVEIPISKGNYWFTPSHGMRCVVGCYNTPSVVHITDKGYANIAYCPTHTEVRILKNILHGINERGLWCECRRGKLIPTDRYDWLKEQLRNLKTGDSEKTIKRLQEKIKEFKKK